MTRDCTDWKAAVKRGLAYTCFPALVAATCWDAGFFVMTGVFLLLLPFEVLFVQSAILLARKRK